MEIDNIKKELSRRFSLPLPEFYKRRIIFWYDEDREFQDQLEEISLDGVELLLVPDAEPDYQNRDYFVRALRIDDPETPIDPAKAEFIMDQGQVKCRIVPVFGGVFTLTDA